jgi:L-asparagine oxygenase
VALEGACLTSLQRQTLEDDGYLFFAAASSEELMAIALDLGEPVPVRPLGPLLQKLTPVPADEAHPRSLSRIHGAGAFPFHTDAAHHRHPPRWVLMRCRSPGPDGRPTLLIDTKGLNFAEGDAKLVRRAVWSVTGGPTTFLASAVSARDGQDAWRYDLGCMSVAAEAFAGVDEVIADALDSADQVPIVWESDAVVIVDNWRMLHARAAVQGDDVRRRWLERVLVKEGP